MPSAIRASMLNIWPAVIIWRGAGTGWAWVGDIGASDAAGGAKSSRDH